MKKYLYILLSLVLIGTSCKMRAMDPIIEPGEVKIAVTAQDVKTGTKAKATDGFVEDSQIGIFSAVDASQSNPVKILDQATTKDFNFIYQADKNSNYWNPINKPIFFDPYKDITLYSYYPSTTTPNSPNTIELSSSGYIAKYKAVTDQSSSDNLQIADLMYAKCTGVSNVNKNVTLPFVHKLSKLRFSVLKDSEWGAAAVKLTNITVSGANIYAQANLSLADGTLTPVSNGQVNAMSWNTDPRVPIHLSSIVAYDIDIIIIPTTYNGTKITFVANDRTYEYELDKDGGFQEATNHIYKVTIMPDGSAQPIIVEPTIQDWDVRAGIIIKPV